MDSYTSIRPATRLPDEASVGEDSTIDSPCSGRVDSDLSSGWPGAVDRAGGRRRRFLPVSPVRYFPLF
jgi:hypothetical protein